MTTQEAFKKLLESPDLIEKLGENMNTIYRWRNRLKAGNIDLSFMEEKLHRAGATKIPEKWKLPKS